MTRGIEKTTGAERCGSALRPTGDHRHALTNADAFIQAALEDPIIRLVMRRDGITAVDVVEVIRQARSRVGTRPSAWAEP